MMTQKVRTLREHDLISSADQDMLMAGFHHFPVVDERYRLIGLVSDRDLLHVPRSASLTVGSVMTRDVHAISPNITALAAAEQMLLSKHNALPVVDSERRLLGIVTSTDFLELARRALSGLDIQQPHVRG